MKTNFRFCEATECIVLSCHLLVGQKIFDCWLGNIKSINILVTKDRVKSMTFSFSKYIKMQGQG